MDLRTFFQPRSIAVVGASADPHTISGRPLRILQQHGFAGALYPVNPKYRELRGLPAYPGVRELPEAVDLALVAVPAPLVPGILAECAARGVRFAMVFSSGFAEAGLDGRRLQEQLRAAIDGTSLRVCGPNCEGFFNLTGGVPAGFSPTIDPERAFQPSEPGPVAIVAQSGGLGFALFNRGLEQGLGFSTVISTGNEVDLDALDYVEYLIDDPATRVILAFVETFRRAQSLPELARRAAERGKPLIVAKIGRSEAGQRAAQSHTGSLVGSDQAYEAVFRQLGIIRVDDVEEMLDAAAFFSGGRLPAGRRVVIMTVSGGGGAWLADACASQGLELPEVEPALQAEIQTHLPSYGATGNPVDATAQALAHGGANEALRLLLRSERFDTLATIVPLTSVQTFEAILPALREAQETTDLALLHFSYTTPTPAPLAALRELGIPCYTSPGRAARALALAASYRAFLDRRATIARFDPGGAWRQAPPAVGETAGELLAPLDLPSPRGGLAESAEQAVQLFRELGGPVALKVDSPDLLHRSDVGGVRLGLADQAAVRAAFDSILAEVRARQPQARLRGVLVQEMVTDGVELILGARVDSDFGPLVLLGLGGLFVETLGDLALRLAPVSAAEVHQMLDQLRGAPLLRGARGRPPADLDALVETAVRFSELAARLPSGVAALEINPLLARAAGRGVMVLDAKLERDGRTGGCTEL